MRMAAALPGSPGRDRHGVARGKNPRPGGANPA